MDQQAHTKKAAPVRRRTARKRAIIAAGLGCAVMAAAALTGWKIASSRPPSPTAKPLDIIKFAATPEFAQMPDERKVPYLLAIKSNMNAIVADAEAGKISPEEQKQATRNVIRSRARLEMKTYRSLPPGPARQALLDSLIDEHEQWKRRAGKNAERNAPDAVALKQFVESLGPEERIDLAAFTFDLVKRRTQRGLPPWPFAFPQPGMGNP